MIQAAEKGGNGELMIDGGKLQECCAMRSGELLHKLHTAGRMVRALINAERTDFVISCAIFLAHRYTLICIIQTYTHIQIDIHASTQTYAYITQYTHTHINVNTHKHMHTCTYTQYPTTTTKEHQGI